MCTLLKDQSTTARVMVTDKLRSYSAAKSQLMPTIGHRSHRRLNNRAENSHLLCDVESDA
jgi:putative transposase